MRAHRAEFSISLMAEAMQVGRRGYYAWLKRDRDPAKQVADERLLQRIRAIHADSRGCCGARRVHAALRASRITVNIKTVRRLMRSAGLQGRHARRKAATTRRGRRPRGVLDTVRRDFGRSRPNELWVADATYLPVRGGHAYLAVVMDACTRQVLGWVCDVKQDARLMLSALRMAASRGSVKGVAHHSDQGSQYTSRVHQKACRDYGIVPSMGSAGDCCGNAMAESWFASMKRELRLSQRLVGAGGMKALVTDYIEGFYNTGRVHSALGCQSPNAYAKALANGPRKRSR